MKSLTRLDCTHGLVVRLIGIGATHWFGDYGDVFYADYRARCGTRLRSCLSISFFSKLLSNNNFCKEQIMRPVRRCHCAIM